MMEVVAVVVLGGPRGRSKPTIPPGHVVPLGRAEVQMSYAMRRRVAIP